MLDPKLQNDQNIPKWNQISCLGQFIGFSHQNSSLIAKVLHIKTINISLQHHVVFDDLFETVYNTEESDPTVDAICNNLFDHKRSWYVLEEYDGERKLLYKPHPLHEVCLIDPEYQ